MSDRIFCIRVSRIKQAWLRRLAICGTCPLMLLYSWTYVPAATIVNNLFALGLFLLAWLIVGIKETVHRPFSFSWTVLRTAWEQW